MRDTSGTGQATEGIVLAALLARRIPVLVPFGNAQRYDLVFDLKNKLYRVQCKTGRVKKGVIRFHSCDNDGRSYRRQVEFLAIHEPNSGAIYLVKPRAVGKQFGSLRLEAPKCRQKKKIHY